MLLPVDPVHDLQIVGALGDVRDEAEEVVGLPVEPEGVQGPERQGRVPDPGEPVVPVPLAAGRLGQGGGRRREQRPGPAEGEPLEREGAALEVRAPRVVRERAPGEPVLPVVRRPDQPPVRLLDARGRRVLAPRHRDETLVALLEQRPCRRAGPLEAQPQVRRQADRRLAVVPLGLGLVVARPEVAPARLPPAVVEDRRAVHGQLHLAVHAADHPQQHVIGVVVGRRAALSVRPLVLVVPGADQQHVTHDDPARRRPPAGLEDHRAGQVAPRRRNHDVGRAQPKPAAVAIEHRCEHARRVHPRQDIHSTFPLGAISAAA